MDGTKIKTNTKINVRQIMAVRVLVLAILGLIVSYIFMISMIATNGANYESIVKKITLEETEVSDLEFKYIEKNREINKIPYETFGLVLRPESESVFVERNNHVYSLNLTAGDDN